MDGEGVISRATAAMVPSLKRIWRECFGDEGRYIDFLFDVILGPGDVLAALDGGGNPQAMLCVRKAELTAPVGEPGACAYIYGVATLPQFQGRGLSTLLLEEAHRRLAAEGVSASVLVPASESLHTFYSMRGYEAAFPLRRAAVTPRALPARPLPCVLEAGELGQLEELRRASFGDSGLFVRWDREYLDAIGAECRLSGGEVLRYSCGGERGYAVCYDGGKRMAVKEITASGRVLDSVLAALHSRFGREEYLVYLRADRGENFSKTTLPFGVIRWYDRGAKERLAATAAAPAYLAHALD